MEILNLSIFVFLVLFFTLFIHFIFVNFFHAFFMTYRDPKILIGHSCIKPVFFLMESFGELVFSKTKTYEKIAFLMCIVSLLLFFILPIIFFVIGDKNNFLFRVAYIDIGIISFLWNIACVILLGILVSKSPSPVFNWVFKIMVGYFPILLPLFALDLLEKSNLNYLDTNKNIGYFSIFLLTILFSFLKRKPEFLKKLSTREIYLNVLYDIKKQNILKIYLVNFIRERGFLFLLSLIYVKFLFGETWVSFLEKERFLILIFLFFIISIFNSILDYLLSKILFFSEKDLIIPISLFSLFSVIFIIMDIWNAY